MNTIDLQITEKEFEVLNAVSQGASLNQRDLSESTGFSLGKTNILIKRLLKKGVLKVRQLNKKKVEYILTPAGFAEKAKKSYNYTLKTIQSLTVFQKAFEEIIREKQQSGLINFALLGEGDLQSIINMMAKSMDWGQGKYLWVKETKNIVGMKTWVYLTLNGVKPQKKDVIVINLLDVLSSKIGGNNK